jgi:hypothetical protein
MTKLIKRTAKSARAHRALTLLGVLVLLAAGAFAVYAATSRPDFKLTTTPSGRTIDQGQAAIYTMKVKRIHRFKGSVKLGVTKLPATTRAIWRLPSGKVLRVTRGVVTLSKKQKTAVLTIQTIGTTVVGTYRPRVKAKGARRTHTKNLTLTVHAPVVGPGGNPGGSPEAAVAVSSDPASRSVVQSDSTSFTTTITRSGGFTGDVTMSVTGLPSGASGSFAPSPTSGSSSTLTIDSGTAAVGSYPLVITATGSDAGNTITGSTPVTLVVTNKQNFTIAGNLGTALTPGSSAPIALTLTNPYDFDLKVTAVSVSLASTSNPAGCPAATNFAVTQVPAASFPITLPAGSTETLPAGSRPQVTMLNLPSTNQDLCKGATLSFDYTGSAEK